MEPLNHNEIRFSFYKFLLLFIITVGLFLGMVYWDTVTPVYISRYFQDQNKILNEEIKFQRKFNYHVTEYLDSMSKYESSNRCKDFRELKSIINTMRLELEKQKIYHQKPMYDSTIAALNNYHEMKERSCIKDSIPLKYELPKKKFSVPKRKK